jgi:hypothetical protein
MATDATEAQITITSSGGDDAAAQIGSATNALKDLGNQNTQLAGQFQERLQHLGLMAFAQESGVASSLGGEARMSINLVNSALIAGADAAGIASGGFMLVVAGLAALAAVAYKVIESHKDESESLDQLNSKTADTLKGYTDQIDQIKNLEAAGVKIPPVLQNLLDADQRVAADLKGNLLDGQEKEIAALEKERAAIQTSADMHAAWLQVLNAVKAAFMEIIAPLKSVTDTLSSFSSHIAAMIPQQTQHVALTKDQAAQYDTLTAKINQVKAAEAGYTSDGIKHIQELKAQSDKYINDEIVKTADLAKKQAEDAIKASATTSQAWMMSGNDYKKMTELEQKQTENLQKIQEEQAKKFEQMGVSAAHSVSNEMGNAFTQMLTSGESFTDAMTAAFHQMATKIISDLMNMITEALVFKSIATAIGGPFGGMTGFATGGHFIAGQFGQDVVTGGPTMFLAGESGPEQVTITPLSGGGTSSAASGSGGGVNIGNIQVSTSVSGVNDPRAIADEIAEEIVKSIKGRAQINFTGPSIF